MRNNHDCAAFNSPSSCAAGSGYDFPVNFTQNFIPELYNRSSQYSICKMNVNESFGQNRNKISKNVEKNLFFS
jgi:hypothetical protein